MLTNNQAKKLRRYIRKTYGRRYIPVRMPNTNISIGDILTSPQDDVAIIDGTEFSKVATRVVESQPVSDNYRSSNKIGVELKAAGKVDPLGKLPTNEAGVRYTLQKASQFILLQRNVCQRSMTNFVRFREELLVRYSRGELSSKAFVVRGVIYAEQFYLQFGSQTATSLNFSLDIGGGATEKNAAFKLLAEGTSEREIDGSRGGVLGYRVSAVRFDREKLTPVLQELILEGLSEEDVLDSLETAERLSLIKSGVISVSEATENYILKSLDDS